MYESVDDLYKKAVGLCTHGEGEWVLGRPNRPVVDPHSRYFAPYLDRMRPLPAAPDLLTASSELGLHVVLATSAKDYEINLMLEAIGAVVSSGALEWAEPDPDLVERALSEPGTGRARAVMVGDAVWGVIAARRAGLPCIGLLSGRIAEEQLRDAGSSRRVPRPAALLGKLRASAIGRLGSGHGTPC